MQLLDLYRSMLNVAGLVATDDGFISTDFNGVVTPTMIKGKRLVLPMPEHLSNPKPNEQIIFHPLSENMLRNESVVLEKYRSNVNVRLHFIISTLVYNLLIIATSPEEHSSLIPDQLEFLSVVKAADSKTLEIFRKILTKMTADQQQNVFINIFLKRGGIIGKTKYSRVGIVNFPFYNELKKNQDNVYDVKIRGKDREVYINIMEYIFPLISVSEAYNRGTNSTVAPYMDALMKTIIAVASPINDQISLFKELVDDDGKLIIESEWVDTFDNLEQMVPQIRMIPMQAGNEGVGSKADNVVAAPIQNVPQPIIQPTPAPVPQQLPQQWQPQPQPQPPYMPQQPQQVIDPYAPARGEHGLNYDVMIHNVPGMLRIPQPQQSYQQQPQPQQSYQQQPQPQQWQQPPQQQWQQPPQQQWQPQPPQQWQQPQQQSMYPQQVQGKL